MGKKRSRRAGGKKGEGPKQIGDVSPGHNSLIKTKELEDAFKRFDRVFDKRETAVAEANADIKALYEEIAGKLGVTRKTLRKVVTEYRHQGKLAEQYREADQTDKDDHDRLMAAASSFGNTPFGLYAAAQAKLPG